MYFPPSVGSWVDDSSILLEKWAIGMEMKALNYCLDETDLTFISMQLVLGSEEEGVEELKLQKHGGEGGWCHRWELKPGDQVARIEYTYNEESGFLSRLRFWTELGYQHILGEGHGRRVLYRYDKYKKFIGFLSYEIDDLTYAFGSFDNYCTDVDGPSYDTSLPPTSNAILVPEPVEWEGETLDTNSGSN